MTAGNRNRIDRGVPASGQFAAQAHTEPDLSLGTPGLQDMPAADMSPEQICEWVAGQVSHHISPVIGWIRRDAHDGKDTSGYGDDFKERARRVADDVAARFSSMPPGLVDRADAARQAREAIEQLLNPTVARLIEKVDPAHRRMEAAAWKAQAAAAAERIGAALGEPVPDAAREDTEEFAFHEIYHQIAPVIGALRLHARNGLADDDRRLLQDWRDSARKAAESIANRFTAPAPVLDGFTAEQVEAKLALDWHQDQCACDRPDGVCYQYGEDWQDQASIPNVRAVFQALGQMAADREPGGRPAS